MGGGIITPGGTAVVCDGSDVCDNLNDVFAHPAKDEYKKAKAQKQLFYDIWKGDGDYEKLHAAYMTVGVKDSLGWKDYLKSLGADNIKHIASARFEGLDRTKRMLTKTHKKEDDDKVHWKQEHDLSFTIDSPFTAKPPKP
jgi:hypothetical protein